MTEGEREQQFRIFTKRIQNLFVLDNNLVLLMQMFWGSGHLRVHDPWLVLGFTQEGIQIRISMEFKVKDRLLVKQWNGGKATPLVVQPLPSGINFLY